MGPYRNHPVLLLKYVLICVFIGAVIAISTEMYYLGALALIPLFFFIRIWYLTRYTFTEEGVEVLKSTAFRSDTNIPYSKVSAINLVRTVLDRIFGTVTVSFNINSSVNSATPEMTLVLKSDTAEQLKVFVESRMYGTTGPEEIPEEEYDCIMFNDLEVITHSFISIPTGSVISSVFFLIYSILAFISSSKEGFSGIFAIFLFFFTLVMPVVRKLLRYFNFKAYRKGDTIYLEHGLLQTYHSSFDVSRVNAVRIRSPLFARLMGRSFIQAEVVGINAMANDSTPTLCLTASAAHNRMIMEKLLPEFIMGDDLTLQPKEARIPLFLKAAVYSSIAVAIAASLCWMLFLDRGSVVDEIGELAFLTIVIGIIALTSIYVAANIFGCIVSLRRIGYHFGEEKFTFTSGVVDRVTTIMQYDRVQMATEISGPLARHYGMSKCSVSFLSATKDGGRSDSGYMPESAARKVSEIVMARINDGRYDYRKNEI